jgi:hypothetical protein
MSVLDLVKSTIPPKHYHKKFEKRLGEQIMYSVNLNNPVVVSERIKVTGAQGVMLSVQEWGNPDGQPILLAHAYGMSHLHGFCK